MPVLGIDVGGTKIAAGLVTEQAEILHSDVTPTRAGEGGHVTIDYQSAERCGCGLPGCIEALASVVL